MGKIARRFADIRFILVALPTCWLLGCANPVDETKNIFPTKDATNDNGQGADADLTADMAGDASAAAPACDCLKVGDWYRFDTLVLKSIDGDPEHLVIGALNPFWQADINHFELNFFAQIKSVAADKIEVYVVNGARTGSITDGKTCILDYTGAIVEFPRNGCKLLSSKPASMNVYAGTTVNTKNCGPTLAEPYGVKNAIPVREAILHAEFSNDCTILGGGKVTSGSFSKVALEKTCTCLTTMDQNSEVCLTPDPKFIDKDEKGMCDGCNSKYQSLSGLLNTFSGGDGLKYTCKDVKGDKAVCLEAEFSAKKISSAQIANMTGSCKP